MSDSPATRARRREQPRTYCGDLGEESRTRSTTAAATSSTARVLLRCVGGGTELVLPYGEALRKGRRDACGTERGKVLIRIDFVAIFRGEAPRRQHYSRKRSAPGLPPRPGATAQSRTDARNCRHRQTGWNDTHRLYPEICEAPRIGTAAPARLCQPEELEATPGGAPPSLRRGTCPATASVVHASRRACR